MIPFTSEAEIVALANDSEFGLGASVFTRNVSRAHRVVSQLEAGTVCANTHEAIDSCLPFGGYKMSGQGRDLGKVQLDHCLQTRRVILRL